MKKISIFPGTFDPITNGHIDLITRAACIFETVIVGIADNKAKKPILGLKQRVDLATSVLSKFSNVQVCGFSNLLVDFAREKSAEVVIRGVRASGDFDYELQLANLNRSLAPDLETVFLAPSSQYAFISSSLVKELASHNGNLEKFVPEQVAALLKGLIWH